MAKSKRRSGRSQAPKNTEEESNDNTADDTCPACRNNSDAGLNEEERESWILCDACKTWYHWRCAGDNNDLESIDKWFCKTCMEADPSRSITLKPPTRKSARKKAQQDHVNLNTGILADPGKWVRVVDEKPARLDGFKRMKGEDVTTEWLNSDSSAMTEPFVIESPEGLGMRMPSKDLTVQDIAIIVGEDTPVEVIDVASQSNTPGWTLGRWAQYYSLDPDARDKIRNVISLEISGSKLGDQITAPTIVRDLDWVEKCWPSSRKGKGHAYPKVQLYCLMGVTNAWTDWHVDFAGSSVYYHVLRGKKVFYFIRPTTSNFSAYERWSGTELQNHKWLGDMVDEVIKVTVVTGNTMIIPTGWIHAVYTPEDSLVFGGNFLHSYDIPTQLKVRQIEISTHVPKKFRFPLFTRLCWYVAEKYLRDLRSKEEFSTRILESLRALSDFLVSEARAIERGSDASRREAKEQVPGDRIKDPSAMAREFRWRLNQLTGRYSDDEDRVDRVSKSLSTGHSKRQREESKDNITKFRHFVPRPWDKIVFHEGASENEEGHYTKPATQAALYTWTEWNGSKSNNASSDHEEVENAHVTRRQNVIVKVRRTADGLQRERIERVLEQWTWSTEAEEGTRTDMLVDT